MSINQAKTGGYGIRTDANKEKLLTAISYISHKIENPTRYKIFKLLFFLDFESFKETGLPVTNLTYYAWKKGPVPKELYNEFNKEKIFEGYFTINSRGKITSSKDYDLDVFSDFELEIIDRLIEKYKTTDGDTLSKITHREGSPWAQTKLQGKIDYLLAIDDETSGLTKEEAQEIYSEYLEFIYNYG